MTTTLHINVRINDLSAWKAGFAEHTETRRQAGVLASSVRHPVGDESRLVVDLEFGTADAAQRFLRFLEENVWKDQPVLAAPPEAVLLEALELERV